MKRFYKLVSVGTEGVGYSIQLDGKPVKAPSGQTLLSPTEALASVIMKEWLAQDDDIIPDTMPLTQLLTTSLDRVGQERAAMEQAVLNYLDTDLLCYRTEEPVDLAQREQDVWNPWLDWFEKTYGERLETTTGLTALKQPAAAHEKVAEQVGSLDDLCFTALQLITSISGSIILALAFVKDAISADDLYDVITVDDQYKAEIYNEDVHGVSPHEETKQLGMRRDLEAAESFLSLVKE